MDDYFDYREPWRSIFVLYALGAFGIGAGLYQMSFGYPSAPPLAGPVAGVSLIGLGCFFGLLASWATYDRFGRSRRIGLSHTALTVPRSRWSASSVTVPLEQITAIRTTRALGARLLHVVSREARYVIRSSMLARAEDFDRLRKLLARRLGEGKLTERDGEESAKQRFRPQFSLASLFIVVTLVALILGSHGYVYGGYAWDTLLDVGFALAVLVGGLGLAWAGAPPTRAFSLGFVFGYFLEVLAVYGWHLFNWVQIPAGSSGPQNWYPLTFPFQRLAESLPHALRGIAATEATLFGGVTSGLACGCVAAIVWCLAAHCRPRASRVP